MPELPEVQTVVTTLRPLLLGRIFHMARLSRNDIVQPAGIDLVSLLVGRSAVAIDRRGKRIIFTLDNGARFYIHLGMTGRLTVQQASQPAESHTHLEIDLTGATGEVIEQLRFRDPRRFGGIWWLGHDLAADIGMGPEPLSLRPAMLHRRLGRTARAVKSALLDQSLIAGLGNIYVDESLFLARIHPLTSASELTLKQTVKLSRAIKLTLSRAIRHGGSTLRDYIDASGKPGVFQKLHRVYDRAGLACRNCKTPIQRIIVGGRSTHFCPVCQLLE